MTGEIERELKQLIAKFGYEKVRDALAPLVAKCAFQDCASLRVYGKKRLRLSTGRSYRNHDRLAIENAMAADVKPITPDESITGPRLRNIGQFKSRLAP